MTEATELHVPHTWKDAMSTLKFILDTQEQVIEFLRDENAKLKSELARARTIPPIGPLESI